MLADLNIDRIDVRLHAHRLYDSGRTENRYPALDPEMSVKCLRGNFFPVRNGNADTDRTFIPCRFAYSSNRVFDHSSGCAVDRRSTDRLVKSRFCDEPDTGTAFDLNRDPVRKLRIVTCAVFLTGCLCSARFAFFLTGCFCSIGSAFFPTGCCCSARFAFFPTGYCRSARFAFFPTGHFRNDEDSISGIPIVPRILIHAADGRDAGLHPNERNLDGNPGRCHQ